MDLRLLLAVCVFSLVPATASATEETPELAKASEATGKASEAGDYDKAYALASAELRACEATKRGGYYCIMLYFTATNTALKAGQSAAALAHARQAMAVGEKFLPPESGTFAMAISHLASVMDGQGQQREAEPLHRRALDIYLKALPKGHWAILTAADNLALNLMDQGKLPQARSLFREVLQQRMDAPDPDLLAIGKSARSNPVRYGGCSGG